MKSRLLKIVGECDEASACVDSGCNVHVNFYVTDDHTFSKRLSAFEDVGDVDEKVFTEWKWNWKLGMVQSLNINFECMLRQESALSPLLC